MTSKYVVLHTSEDGLYDIVKLTDNILGEVLLFCKDHFFTTEAICKGLNLIENPFVLFEFTKFLTMVYADGLSAAIIEKSTDQIITVICFKLMKKDETQTKSYFGEFADNHCTDEFAKSIFQFLEDISVKVNILEQFNVENVFDCVCLVTHKDYRRKQFGVKIGEFVATIILKNDATVLPEKCINMFENLDNYAFRAVCTSEYSRQIANSWGCKNITEVDFSEFQNGKFADKFPKSYKITTVACKLTNLIPL